MWPALIIMAVSAFMKHQANQEASEKRDSLRNSMEAFQRDKARQSEEATEALLTKQTPKERTLEMEDVTQARDQSLRETVGAAQAFDAAPVAGKHSGDYAAATQAEASRVAERTRRAIEQLATMGAPQEQAIKSGARFGQAAGTVDAANRASENVGRGYLNDISGVVPDPATTMMADVGMSVGGAMAGGAGTEGGGGAAMMGANSAGNFSYEDSAGNLHQSAIPYRIQQPVKRTFSLWGAR